MCNPFSLYLQHPLKDTMTLIDNYYKIVSITMCSMIIISAGYITYLFMHMSKTPRDYGTMHAMEHAPITTPLLLVCTHIVMAFFSRKIYNEFKSQKKPLSPSLFIFIIGKVFMIFRMIMAYSSSNYGDAMEFFLLEECLLILVQVITTAKVFPYLKLSYDCSQIEGQERVWKVVIMLDSVKTFAIFILWQSYTPSSLSVIFNRIPGVEAQIFVFVCVHVLTDVLQSISTIFSLYVAKMCSREVICITLDDEARSASLDKSNQTKSCTLELCQWMDSYFIRNTFKYSDVVAEANIYCDELINVQQTKADNYGTAA